MSADVCVVVPTIREHERLRDYVENARANDFDVDRLHFVLVTEDFCDADAMAATLEDEGVAGRVFDAAARTAWFEARGLSRYADLIPAASHAQTSFGPLYLWANGFEYGVFVDDDTRPHRDFDFFGRHLRNLQYRGEMPSVASEGGWVNVLHHNVDEHGLYPRGYPYAATDAPLEVTTADVVDPVVSQGLWTGVPDLDAVRILGEGDPNGRGSTRLSRADYDGTFLAAPGSYLTLCSMNLAFRREVVPAFYQLPMDDNPWGVGRFDDIWSGVFVKRACDLLGRQIVTGYPLCVHEKAPRSTFVDLAAEAPALELNEHLWRIVDDAGTGAETFAGAYAAMADRLVDGDWSALENGDFLGYVGEHMRRWLECLRSLDASVEATATAAD